MKKSVLISIISIVLSAFAIIIFVSIAPKNNCKHDDPTQIVDVDAVAPTCQQTGLTEGMMCNLCGTMVVPQRIVDTIECIESEWIIDVEVTNAVDGKKHTECIMCEATLDEMVIPSGIYLKYTLLDNGTYEVSGIGRCNNTDIVIPNEYNGLPVTSIGEEAFGGCFTLTSVTIPDSVTSIGYMAFNSCQSLESVTIPDTVTNIDRYAFQACTSLTNVTIPDSVTSIGAYAFVGCDSLTSVTIPDSVTSIGECVFSCCISLTSIDVDENNKYYKSIDGNLYNKAGTMLFQYATGKQERSFIIPDFVTSTEVGAFFGCESLTSVTIGGSMTSIPAGAFSACTSLTSVTIPDSVTSIDDAAFIACKSLASITIPSSVVSIGSMAFRNCTSLTSVTIGGSVTSIGEEAFYWCESLTSISFEGSVEQWNAINKGADWNYGVPATEVICSGTVPLN